MRACGFARGHSLSDEVITWDRAAAARGPSGSHTERQQRRGRCVPPARDSQRCQPCPQTTHRRLFPAGSPLSSPAG